MATKAKARRVAKKVVAPEMSEARVKARTRNVESRKRAEAESGIKANASRVELYRIKNRKTGEVRILIDARGDGSVADKPWLVTSEDGKNVVGFGTRKELGANYAHVSLSGGSAKKARAKRVARKTA